MFLNQASEVSAPLNISVFLIELTAHNCKFGVFLLYLSAGYVCVKRVKRKSVVGKEKRMSQCLAATAAKRKVKMSLNTCGDL